MPTFKVNISNYTRSDNKRQIRIRVTHNRQSAFIKTPYYVSKSDLDENDNILSKQLRIELQSRIVDYEKTAIVLSGELDDMTLDKLLICLSKPDKPEEINLIPYFKSKIETFTHTKAKQTVANYYTTWID